MPALPHADALAAAYRVLDWLSRHGVEGAQRITHGRALLACLLSSPDPRKRREPDFHEISSGWLQMREAERRLDEELRFGSEPPATPPETAPRPRPLPPDLPPS